MRRRGLLQSYGYGISRAAQILGHLDVEFACCLPDSAWAGGNLAEWAYHLGSDGRKTQIVVNIRWYASCRPTLNCVSLG